MNDIYEKLVRDGRAALVSRPVFKAALGTGSIVILDFASPGPDGVQVIDSYIRTECAWRLETPQSVLVASEDDREQLREQIAKLTNRRVMDLIVLYPSLELQLSFEEGCRLCVFPVYAASAEYENWCLRTPERLEFVAGPGRELRVVKPDDPG